ncbi:uncharacterized protein LOC116851075 [Odontomachus brunneus]|uniref:uncharacterized protein LOC116851075 n=1 Tax=Odontomachus brunneus TaxID=486640 RepID=UPI0013F2A447|nr:uncharacterized protein LOC116851075 [Odontomachus brunneus]
MSLIKCITLEEELKKNPELKLSDIQILRDWCEKQPHLPKIQDVELAIFLHSNYYHIEPTKSTIENYYTYRTHIPELFSNRDIRKVKRLRDAFKVAAILPLKLTTKEGYIIVMSRLIDMDPSHFFYNESTNAAFMIFDEFLWTCGSVLGNIYVGDATGFTMAHVGRINLALMKKFIYYVENAMPIRLKQIHIINTTPVMEVLYNIIKPFVSEELKNLIHFHTSLESAKKYFPIEALPNELGGKAGPIQELMDIQLKKIENFCEWFVEDEKNNRVNESLRIGNSKTSSDLFGVDGSFKTIEFDFHIHSTLETVSEYLPIEALPNELGGKAGAIRELQDVHLKKMENLREFFLEDEKCKRVNESLRIGKCKTSSDLFGVDVMSSIKCITLEGELKKNSELKLSDIQILREWCEKQPHLPKIEDVELAIFLYLSYYHIESAKNTIENYYTYRTHAPELFSNRDILKVKRLRDSFQVMPHIVLESTTKEGYNIILGQFIDANPSHFFHNESLSALLMTYDEFLWTRGSIVGLVYMCNAADFTIGHVGRFNLTSLKKVVYYLQGVILMRIKAVHLINMSPAAVILYNMIKPFFSDKLINLIHIHSTLESVNEYLPIEALPDEFGGKAGTIRELTNAQLKKLENFHEWFLEDEKYKRVDESLRIGKSKTSSDLFGVDGSFKKLDFD